MMYFAQALPGLENQTFLVIVLIAGLVILGGVIAFLVKFIIQILNEKDVAAAARLSDSQSQNEKIITLTNQTTENVRILNDVLNRVTKRGN